MIDKRLFNIRIQLNESTITVLKDMFDYINFFYKENPNIFLELYLWINKDMKNLRLKKTLIDICKENDVSIHDNVFLTNKVFVDISPSENNLSSKFNLYYNSDDEFIKNLLTMFSIVKTTYRKEAIKDENRDNRKQILYEKIKNKRITMDDKEK